MKLQGAVIKPALFSSPGMTLFDSQNKYCFGVNNVLDFSSLFKEMLYI